MPVSRCPRCDTQVQVDDRDLGYDVECPNCRAVFEARPLNGPPARRQVDRRPDEEGEDDRPRRRYEEDDDDEDYDRPRRRRRNYSDDPEELIDEAKRAVFMPGLFTVLVCVLGMGYQLVDMIAALAMPQLLKNNPLMRGANIPLEVYVLLRVLAIIWEAVILAGASAMMRLRSYRFARVAMVLRVVPFLGCCFVLGAAFGIWGLVALNRPEVKEGFEEARRARERGPRPSPRREHRGYDDEDEDR